MEKIQIFFREIDLFDFTSFLAEIFLNFLAQCGIHIYIFPNFFREIKFVYFFICSPSRRSASTSNSSGAYFLPDVDMRLTKLQFHRTVVPRYLTEI